MATYAFYFAVGFTALFFFWGEEFLLLVVGEQYIGAWSTTVLLAINKIISIAFGFCMLIMISTGNGRKVTQLSLLYIPVYLLGVLFFSRYYGADGAALGAIAFTLLLNFSAYRFVKKENQINCLVFLSPTAPQLRP